jgi:transglutaminase-like putative cysteine protease
MPEDALFEAPPNHYWRSLTYDTYTGRGWATSRTETRSYEADEPVQEPDLPAHRVLNQRVQVIDENDRILYAAGSLVTVNQPYKVAWRRGQGEDIFGVTAESNTYRVQTLVSTATVKTLETAGTTYPAWITDRYLALPENIPTRVLNLARDLTATEPTPYDRATAIEQYLRTTYPYTLNVPQPPVDQDIADYFLFDLQKGYCDYYATAMVVLARAAGLPARMAVGYITGTYDALNAQYIVTEAEAHAWVEIYFPGYGWIKFEPTGGRPELWRPSDENIPTWEPPTDLPDTPDQRVRSRPWLLRYWYLTILGSAAAVVLVVLIWSSGDLLWLSMQPFHKLVFRLYRRLRQHGQRLNVPMHTGDTPHEFREAFIAQLTGLATNKRLRARIERAIEEADQLIELYVRLNYTVDAWGKEQQTLALQLWRHLRWRLWTLRIWQRLMTWWASSSLRPILRQLRSAYEQ